MSVDAARMAGATPTAKAVPLYPTMSLHPYCMRRRLLSCLRPLAAVAASPSSPVSCVVHAPAVMMSTIFLRMVRICDDCA